MGSSFYLFEEAVVLGIKSTFCSCAIDDIKWVHLYAYFLNCLSAPDPNSESRPNYFPKNVTFAPENRKGKFSKYVSR